MIWTGDRLIEFDSTTFLSCSPAVVKQSFCYDCEGIGSLIANPRGNVINITKILVIYLINATEITEYLGYMITFYWRNGR